MRRFVADLAAVHPLRLDPGQAADIVWATNATEMYQLLVTQRGWTPQRYERSSPTLAPPAPRRLNAPPHLRPAGPAHPPTRIRTVAQRTEPASTRRRRTASCQSIASGPGETTTHYSLNLRRTAQPVLKEPPPTITAR